MVNTPSPYKTARLSLPRIPELVERAKKLTVNGGKEQGADVGPLISPEVGRSSRCLITNGTI